MTDTRRQIHDYIEANPGVHFNALVRELDLASGQVQYHVRKLSRASEIVDEHVYGQTHYYPPTYSEWERAAIALFRRETSRELLCYLLANGPARPGDVADSIGIARSTLEWHLNRLTEQDVVRKRHTTEGVVLDLTRPDETRDLLEEVKPSTVDRLVDRFMALVDDALEPEQ